MTRRSWALISLVALVGIAILLACGSSGNTSRSTGTLTNVSLSDPTTCGAPNGPFSNIFVTVTDVQVNVNPLAGDNDAGWQTAIPDNQGKPQQVDLLGTADTQCFLKQLGSSTQLQPGSYQQIRVILADNLNQPAPNACGQAGSNCVILTADPLHTPRPLALSSEARTGIKIPSGQIAGGKFVVATGQQQDLNLDFNACASIITQANNGFRLKPVLHAGEVTVASTISGRIVDKATNQAIAGGTVVVALEVNNGGTETVVMQTTADINGNFNFCPVSPLTTGSYDVVAAGISGNTAYAATITTGVSAGAVMGNIPLTAMGAPATITGTVTTQSGTTQVGATSDIAVAALQSVTVNNVAVKFAVPLAQQGAVSVPLSTESKVSCPANTFCQDYSMALPAATPALGVFSTTSPSWTVPAAGTSYFINAQATVPQSGGAANCSLSNQTTAAIAVTAGTPATAPRLDFTGCQ